VRATSQPPVRRWTGVQVTDPSLPGLEIWLARLGGLTRLINRRPGHGLVPATGTGGSLAVLDSVGEAFAYLIWRAGASRGTTRELGVCAYGQNGDPLADRVIGQVQAWAAQQPTVPTSIEIYALGVPVPSPGDVLLTVAKEHTQIVVRAVERSVLAERRLPDSGTS
jgi:hypothetical protein